MWLMVGIITLLVAIYKSFFSVVEDSTYFFLFAGVAFLLYFLRRKQRMRIEKNNSGKVGTT